MEQPKDNRWDELVEGVDYRIYESEYSKGYVSIVFRIGTEVVRVCLRKENVAVQMPHHYNQLYNMYGSHKYMKIVTEEWIDEN